MKKEIFLSGLSAILLVFSFPNYNIWLFAWFGFVPLFFALRGKSKGEAFLLSYLTGVIFWSGTIYWLIHVTLPGMILLVLYLALYFGIFGLIISTINYQLSTINLLFMPSVWVVLEYIRSHLFTGFPWALLGYSQYLNLPIIQVADLTGVCGVSFLVMMVNVSLYYLLATFRLPFTVYRLPLDDTRYTIHGTRNVAIISFIILTLVFSYGFFRLSQHNEGNKVRISVIQGNIPQELKWEETSREFIINKYLYLTKQAAKEKPDIIIWPEASLPVVLEEEPIYFERIKALVREIETPLLLGAVTLRDNSYYNSALLISGNGGILRRYDKLHLVPFGEYIPLKKILTFLETVVPIGDFIPGKEYTIFRNQNNFSVLICFEDLFPELSREFVKRGAEFLVNITNDAWYKKTSASFQHLQASVFRAVENRVFLVRCANTGVSGFISPNGQILSLVQDETREELFVDGYRTQEIMIPANKISIYTRCGDFLPLVCLLFTVYAIIIPLKNRK